MEASGPPGQSLMEAARDIGVPGIDGDCGGVCACGSCHVYAEPEWRDRLGERSEMEAEMLEMSEGVTDASRLACQIRLDQMLDGLTVRVPAQQR